MKNNYSLSMSGRAASLHQSYRMLWHTMPHSDLGVYENLEEHGECPMVNGRASHTSLEWMMTVDSSKLEV